MMLDLDSVLGGELEHQVKLEDLGKGVLQHTAKELPLSTPLTVTVQTALVVQ
jgi:hypothetical protein